MRFVVVALLAVLTGCSLFTRSIERPSAKVRDVSLSSAGFSGISGELSLDVMNPNPVGVPLSGIEWELSINGARAMTGTVELSKTIPARGVAPVTTMLKLDAGDAVTAGSALAIGARGYKVRAKLRFATPVGPLEVQVEHAGMLGAGGIVGAI
jgi:LEA14-like dessication related protein